MRVVAIVPAFQRGAHVAGVVRGLLDAGFHACVVDDGSDDRTAREARAAGATVLSLPVNLGVAGRCGAAFAGPSRLALTAQCRSMRMANTTPRRSRCSSTPSLLSRPTWRSAPASSTDLALRGQPRPLGGMQLLSPPRPPRPRAHASWTRRPVPRDPRRPLLDRFADDYPVEYLGDTVEALIIAGAAGATVIEVPVGMKAREHGEASAGRLASFWYVPARAAGHRADAPATATRGHAPRRRAVHMTEEATATLDEVARLLGEVFPGALRIDDPAYLQCCTASRRSATSSSGTCGTPRSQRALRRRAGRPRNRRGTRPWRAVAEHCRERTCPRRRRVHSPRRIDVRARRRAAVSVITGVANANSTPGFLRA